jgi:hypothetical protein
MADFAFELLIESARCATRIAIHSRCCMDEFMRAGLERNSSSARKVLMSRAREKWNIEGALVQVATASWPNLCVARALCRSISKTFFEQLVYRHIATVIELSAVSFARDSKLHEAAWSFFVNRNDIVDPFWPRRPLDSSQITGPCSWP